MGFSSSLNISVLRKLVHQRVMDEYCQATNHATFLMTARGRWLLCLHKEVKNTFLGENTFFPSGRWFPGGHWLVLSACLTGTFIIFTATATNLQSGNSRGPVSRAVWLEPYSPDPTLSPWLSVIQNGEEVKVTRFVVTSQQSLSRSLKRPFSSLD